MYYNALVKKNDLEARRVAKLAEMKAAGVTEAGAVAAWACVVDRRRSVAGLSALETLAAGQAAADAAAAAVVVHLKAAKSAATAEAAAAKLQDINADCCGLCEAVAKGISVAVEARRAASEAEALCAARKGLAEAERARVAAALKASEEVEKRDAAANAAVLLMLLASIVDPEAGVPPGLLQRSRSAASGEKDVVIPNTSNIQAEVSCPTHAFLTSSS